jgi:hypothetical protein
LIALAAIGSIEQVIDVVLTNPPVEHNFQPRPFNPFVHFEAGVVGVVTRHPGFVRMTMATEAGRIVITDLSPNDAATAGELLTGGAAAQPLEVC